jgi:S-adenosyl methyltransferase
MSADPPAASGPDSDDPIGARYPNTARIWNYQLGGQPVGIMFMCVLHCLWDREDPWGVVARFRDAVAPGSYLALSHMTREAHPEAADGLFRMTQELHWNTPLISRDRAGIARFFDGFTLVAPGLVAPAQWHSELDNPLRDRPDHDGGEPVVRLTSPGRPADDRGIGWHLCGVGVKDQPGVLRSGN